MGVAARAAGAVTVAAASVALVGAGGRVGVGAAVGSARLPRQPARRKMSKTRIEKGIIGLNCAFGDLKITINRVRCVPAPEGRSGAMGWSRWFTARYYQCTRSDLSKVAVSLSETGGLPPSLVTELALCYDCVNLEWSVV